MSRGKVLNSKNRKHIPRENQSSDNTKMQMALAPVVLEFLNAFGATPDRTQEVDFFFYANTESAARSLAMALKEMKYEVLVTKSAADDSRFLITGRTEKMRMDDGIMQSWTKKMCGLAEQYDCQFDGWGMIAEME